MKKILTFTLALALFAVIFSSCKEKKKEIEPEILETLVGTTWVSSYTTSTGEYNEELTFETSEFKRIIINGTQIETRTGIYFYEKPNIRAILQTINNLPVDVPGEGDKGVVSGNTITLWGHTYTKK